MKRGEGERDLIQDNCRKRNNFSRLTQLPHTKKSFIEEQERTKKTTNFQFTHE